MHEFFFLSDDRINNNNCDSAEKNKISRRRKVTRKFISGKKKKNPSQPRSCASAKFAYNVSSICMSTIDASRNNEVRAVSEYPATSGRPIRYRLDRVLPRSIIRFENNDWWRPRWGSSGSIRSKDLLKPKLNCFFDAIKNLHRGYENDSQEFAEHFIDEMSEKQTIRLGDY